MTAVVAMVAGLLVAVGGVAYAACADDGAAAPAAWSADLAGTRWHLVAFGDGQPPVDGSGVTLGMAAEEPRAGGRGSVNHYTGAVTVAGDQLTFGPIASTKMAGPPPLMQQEARYFAALAQVGAYQVTDGRLILLDGAGQALLEFAAAA